MKKFLVIDNYDSFTFNLVQMFLQFPLQIDVHRNDCISLAQIESFAPDYILISPGPKDPLHSGISMQIIARFHSRIPILGVCLGMQCINEFFGGQTSRCLKPLHGKTSLIIHQGRGLFTGLPSPFQAARYHSLYCRVNPDSELLTVAYSPDDLVMGLQHFYLPLFGVQFHPESFMTEHGFQLIKNFLTFSSS